MPSCSAAGPSSPAFASDHSFSKAALACWTSSPTLFSTSRAASSNSRLHLLQFVELDRAVDLGLDVGHVALRLAQHVADRARHARQLLGADDDQRHGADQRDLVEAEVDHGTSRRWREATPLRSSAQRTSGLGPRFDVDRVGVGGLLCALTCCAGAAARRPRRPSRRRSSRRP